MQLHGWTHGVLDPETGAPIGVAKDIDEIPEWGQMGTTLYFAGDGPPQYNWLKDHDVLPLEQLDAQVRAEIALTLTFVPA